MKQYMMYLPHPLNMEFELELDKQQLQKELIMIDVSLNLVVDYIFMDQLEID